MPLGVKPVCSTCKTVASTMWRKGCQGEVLCNSCGLKQMNNTGNNITSSTTSAPIVTPCSVVIPSKESVKELPKDLSSAGSVERDVPPKLTQQLSVASVTSVNGNNSATRKSSRIRPSGSAKNKSQNLVKTLATKGKSRRVIFKKNPIKSATAVATVVTSDSLIHEGMYYQIGDIVSLLDHDGGLYYAQIRGFMQDQFCEKSAVITWLLPTQASVKESFDPNTFILGPEEELPRKMEFLEFVCHAPSNYFTRTSSTVVDRPGYVWTRIGKAVQTLPTTDEIFGSDQ